MPADQQPAELRRRSVRRTAGRRRVRWARVAAAVRRRATARRRRRRRNGFRVARPAPARRAPAGSGPAPRPSVAVDLVAQRPAIRLSSSGSRSRVAVVVGVNGQRELRPGEVFEVGRLRRVDPQVPHRRIDPRVVGRALQREQHERGRPGDRLGRACRGRRGCRSSPRRSRTPGRAAASAPRCTRGWSPCPTARSARHAHAVGSTHPKFASAHGHPTSDRSMSISMSVDFRVRLDDPALDRRAAARRSAAGRRA